MKFNYLYIFFLIFSCSVYKPSIVENDYLQRSPSSIFRVEKNCYEQLMYNFSADLESDYKKHFNSFTELVTNNLEATGAHANWKFRAKSRGSIRKKLTKIPHSSSVVFNANRLGYQVGGPLKSIIKRITGLLVPDGLAGRLIFDEANQADMDKLIESLSKAIEQKKIRLVSMSNYQTENGYSYLTDQQIAKLKEASKVRKLPLIVKSKNKATLSSGYTSLHLILWYPGVGRTEVQIRARKIDILSEINHIYYDVTQGKPLSDQYSGDRRVVNIYQIFKDFDEEQVADYLAYTAKYYEYMRASELNEVSTSDLPTLPESLSGIKEIEIPQIWDVMRDYYENGLFRDYDLFGSSQSQLNL